MINDARVEMNTISGNGNVLPTTGRYDMHYGSSTFMTLSYREGAPHGGFYDEDASIYTNHVV